MLRKRNTAGLMSKTELMKLVANGAVHESFEHSTDGTFDITAMREWASKNKASIVSFSINDILVDHIRTARVIDEQRVADLDDGSWRNDPAMVVLFDEGASNTSMLLIDGTHRILRRHKEGLVRFSCYLIHVKDAIRPDSKEWVRCVERGIDWGDTVTDGQIVKRSTQ